MAAILKHALTPAPFDFFSIIDPHWWRWPPIIRCPLWLGEATYRVNIRRGSLSGAPSLSLTIPGYPEPHGILGGQINNSFSETFFKEHVAPQIDQNTWQPILGKQHHIQNCDRTGQIIVAQQGMTIRARRRQKSVWKTEHSIDIPRYWYEVMDGMRTCNTFQPQSVETTINPP